jgi:hypothetical protein
MEYGKEEKTSTIAIYQRELTKEGNALACKQYIKQHNKKRS